MLNVPIELAVSIHRATNAESSILEDPKLLLCRKEVQDI